MYNKASLFVPKILIAPWMPAAFVLCMQFAEYCLQFKQIKGCIERPVKSDRSLEMISIESC